MRERLADSEVEEGPVACELAEVGEEGRVEVHAVNEDSAPGCANSVASFAGRTAPPYGAASGACSKATKTPPMRRREVRKSRTRAPASTSVASPVRSAIVHSACPAIVLSISRYGVARAAQPLRRPCEMPA